MPEDMTSENEKTGDKKPLKLKKPNTLGLKKTVETGRVQQSFSHGRKKAVTVEVRRSRNFERDESGRMKAVSSVPPVVTDQKKPTAVKAKNPERRSGQKTSGQGQDMLTDAEREKRLRVLEAARKADEERQILEEQQRVEEQARAARAAEERARRDAETAREREREERERREMEEEEQRVSVARSTRQKDEREAVDLARATADARRRRRRA